MNLIIVDAAEIRGGRAIVSGRRADHIVEVLQAGTGDRVRVGVVRGPTGTAIVEAISSSEVTLRMTLASELGPTRPGVELVLAMPRPKVLSRVLQTAASFGVARIDVINAWRVDKSYLSSTRLAPERLREELLIGCEQGRTTWLPDIAVHPRMMPFVDGPLTERLAAPQVRGLLAHPGATAYLEATIADPTTERVIVAIGPEGGWIQREVETFVDRGCQPISLGTPILRVEAAIAALLAQLDLLRRTRGG